MLKQLEGSRAVAEAVAMCRPAVICAVPGCGLCVAECPCGSIEMQPEET